MRHLITVVTGFGLLAMTFLSGCATKYQPKTVQVYGNEIGEEAISNDELAPLVYNNDFRFYLTHRLRGTPVELDSNSALISEIASRNKQTLSALYGEEFDLINLKRKAAADPQWSPEDNLPVNLRGLCLSGGGIRSASFNAGVLQGLHELGLLKDMDYLSSVSGGSYIAGWYMTRHLMDDNELFNPSNPQMRYLLSHGNYLTSGHAGNAAPDMIRRGLIHTLTIPFHWVFNGIFGFNQNIGAAGNMSVREIYRISLADTFLCDYSESFVRDMGVAFIQQYKSELEQNTGLISKLSHATDKLIPDAVQDAVPGDWVPREPSMTDILKNAKKSARTKTESERIDRLIAYLETGDAETQTDRWRAVVRQLGAVHTIATMANYRERPYLIRRTGSGADEVHGEPRNWHMADLKISETGRIDTSTAENNPFSVTSSIRPFWIANAGLGLRDDKTLFKNQFGDNFELTPLYCGADAIGYVRTDNAHKWMGLSYVLQVSGAAVSQTNDMFPRVFRATIRMLNLDLGRYVNSWNYDNKRLGRQILWTLSAFYPVYKTLNMFGVDTGHKRNYNAFRHFISDGGFYENLGALSVIRRGCRYVIISDSGHDDQYLGGEGRSRNRAFFDLRRLGLRLKNELGAELILPADGKDATGPIMIGEIRNLPVEGGGRDTVKIIYIKPTFSDIDSVNYADYIEGYKSSKDGLDFPHQPTGDQFFSEAQLTAYRELGYHTIIANKETILEMKAEYSAK